MENKTTQALESIKERLREFTVACTDGADLVWENDNSEPIPISRSQFPIPSLILYVLNGLCMFPQGYRGDKTHWMIPFVYQDVNCAISHEKFGVRLYIHTKYQHQINPDELLGKLRKAIEISEKYILAEIAQDQIKSGNITIENHFHKLRSQYHYFRKQAASIYSEDIDNILKIFPVRSEGSYNSLAMIDSYFSFLEHFFVLALPFSSYDRATDNLVDFVGAIWSKKLQRILDIKNPTIHGYYNRLVEIKEKYRNTFAHGGFEKKGQSFYFHLPDYGAIPASMSAYRNSVHFNFFPIEESSFQEICTLLDQFDDLLKSSALVQAWKFAESGLHLTLDEKNLSEIILAASDPISFDSWLEKESYLSDMYANADY